MGFHTCEYCFDATSSGDVLLTFENGHSYSMPDMLVHYVAEHQYQPPAAFIADVMSGQLRSGARVQTRSLPEPIGYLCGETYPQGPVPHLFVFVLAGMMALAAGQGARRQTRGG